MTIVAGTEQFYYPYPQADGSPMFISLLPTVGLSNEALAQIRQIVREEIQLALQFRQECKQEKEEWAT